MRVTKWISYDEAINSPDYVDLPDRYFWEAFKVVVNEMKEKGYRFSGATHQEDKHGVPIIDDKYAFACSCRRWGDVMSFVDSDKELKTPIDEKTMDYVDWAWAPKTIGYDEQKGEYQFAKEILPQ